MTSKLTITREQATDKEIQMLIDSHENGTAMFLRVDAYYLMAKELQERRKAAMDGEPVAESEQLAIENFRSAMEGIGHIRRTLEETLGGLHGTHVEPDVLAECKAICDAIYASYRHAQPAQVVPSFEEWLSAANRKPLGWVKDAMREAYDACRSAMLQAGISAVIPDGYVMVPKEPTQAMCAAFNDSDYGRKSLRERYVAMLAAAQQPQDEPQNIPEIIPGWIPVSERMPPPRYEVLVGRWWGEKPRWCCKWATYIPGHPDSQSSGWLIPGASWTPTHWMPLPAAPQEVSDA